jgi:hypothetical protein
MTSSGEQIQELSLDLQAHGTQLWHQMWEARRQEIPGLPSNTEAGNSSPRDFDFDPVVLFLTEARALCSLSGATRYAGKERGLVAIRTSAFPPPLHS